MPCRLPMVLLIASLTVLPGAIPAAARILDANVITSPRAAVSPMPGEAFGAEVVLPPRTIIYVNGETSWENVFRSLSDAFERLDSHLKKAGINPDGPAMTIYTETNDEGFKFLAARPIAATPVSLPSGDVSVGKAPAGKALLFVHRGTYKAMDATYEAITNYLEDREIEAKDEFIEEYVSDMASGPDNMVINVLVPVK